MVEFHSWDVRRSSRHASHRLPPHLAIEDALEEFTPQLLAFAGGFWH
jgi:hypothetical protein